MEKSENKIKKLLKDQKMKFFALTINEKISFIFLRVSILFIIIFAIELIVAWVVPSWSILDMPLIFDSIDSFMDFINVGEFVSQMNPYNHPHYSSYPPLALLFSKLFSFFIPYDKHVMIVRDTVIGGLGYGLFAVSAITALLILFKIYCKRKSINLKTYIIYSIIILSSFPFLFLFIRGNNIIISLIFTVVFMLFYNSESKVKREMALISLAIASALKLYPIVFIVVLFRKKMFWGILRTAVYAVILFFIPFIFFNGGFNNIPLFFENLSSFSKTSLIYHNESFFLITKGFITAFDLLGWPIVIVEIIEIIFKIIFVVAATIGFLYTKKSWHLSAVCFLCLALFPYPSNTYVFIFSVIPLFQFLNDKDKTKKDYFFLIVFLITLMPIQLGFINQRLSRPFWFATNCVLIMISNITMFIVLVVMSFKNMIEKFKNKKPFDIFDLEEDIASIESNIES